MDLDELRAIPHRMADQVRELLPAMTLESYPRWLDAMLHHARGHGARLAWAAEHAAPGERAAFAALARDDAHHHRLAEADLAALGHAPSPAPPRAVVDLDASWRRWDAAGWIGALHALASVGAHLAADVQHHLDRLGLGLDRTRFLVAYLTTGVAPSDAQLARALAADRAATLSAARTSADCWVGLAFDALA